MSPYEATIACAVALGGLVTAWSVPLLCGFGPAKRLSGGPFTVVLACLSITAAFYGVEWGAITLVRRIPPFTIDVSAIVGAFSVSLLATVAGMVAAWHLRERWQAVTAGAALALALVPPVQLVIMVEPSPSGLAVLVGGAIAAAVLLATAFHLGSKVTAPGARVLAGASFVSGLAIMPLATMALASVDGEKRELDDPLSLVMTCGGILGALMPWLADGLAAWRSHSAHRQANVMRSLLDCASQGLVLCELGRIVTVNQAFEVLTGCDHEALSGRTFLSCLADSDRRAGIDLSESLPVEATLRGRCGVTIPVEIRRGTARVGGRTLESFAVQDLREWQRLDCELRAMRELVMAGQRIREDDTTASFRGQRNDCPEPIDNGG
jgi:PAS domain-containing protein